MTKDPAIEAMCRAGSTQRPWPSPYDILNNADRTAMAKARAAIPIGSEWTGPQGIQVVVVPKNDDDVTYIAMRNAALEINDHLTIGSEWTTPEGVRVMVEPIGSVNGMTPAVRAAMRHYYLAKAKQFQDKQP